MQPLALPMQSLLLYPIAGLVFWVSLKSVIYAACGYKYRAETTGLSLKGVILPDCRNVKDVSSALY